MLTHLHETPSAPRRVVVLGAGGFVGSCLADRLERDGIPVARLTRHDFDLLSPDAGERLAARLLEGDSVVAVPSITPCKTPEALKDNLVLATAIVRAVNRVRVAHVINISSDAVFADEPMPLREDSPRAPTSYYGIMHVAREIMFATEVKAPLAILRPTMIYGAKDRHSGYGPNQFRRKANTEETITLFGEGEERRDHVAIDDVAELVARALSHRSTGSLNLVTGVVTSFRDIAELAVQLAARPVAIRSSVRQGPMPHNGYRPFDNSATSAAFPDFRYTPLAEGMARAQQLEFPRG